MLTPATRAVAWRMLWELKLIDTLYRFLKVSRRRADASRPFFFDRVAPGEQIPFGLALAAAVVCYRMQVDSALADPRSLFSRNEVQAAVHSMRQAPADQQRRVGADARDAGGAGAFAGRRATFGGEVEALSRGADVGALAGTDGRAGVERHPDRAERVAAVATFELEKTDFAPAPLHRWKCPGGARAQTRPPFQASAGRSV